MVEIGTGIGVLTESIVQKAKKVIAVEIDRNLVELLKDKLGSYDNFEVHSGDVLKFHFEAIAKDITPKSG